MTPWWWAANVVLVVALIGIVAWLDSLSRWVADLEEAVRQMAAEAMLLKEDNARLWGTLDRWRVPPGAHDEPFDPSVNC